MRPGSALARPVRAAASFAGAILIWWAAVTALGVPAFVLPSPVEIAPKLVFLAREASLWRHAWVTIGEIAAGFVVGGSIGVLTGALFARAPRLERLAAPLVLLLQTAPKIALAPLLILWLGLGATPKIALVAVVTFFPAMAGALAGFRYADPAYRDLAAVLGLRPLQRFTRIDLPFAMPPILSGLRIATTQGVTAAIIGELMGATHGLGSLLASGQEMGDAATVICVVLLLALIGWSLHELVRTVERHLLSWHASNVDERLS